MSKEVPELISRRRLFGLAGSAVAAATLGAAFIPEDAEASTILEHPFWGKAIKEGFQFVDVRWSGEWDGRNRKDGLPKEIGRNVINLQLKEDEFDPEPRFPKIMLNGTEPLPKEKLVEMLGGKKLALFCKGNVRAPELLTYLKENVGVNIAEAIFLEGGMDRYLRETEERRERVGEIHGNENDAVRVASR